MNPDGQHSAKYSAADISRYLQGEMTAAEMHALERAALSDPFLADALDGYAETRPGKGVHREAELEALRMRLAERTKIHRDSRVITGNWWRAAAVIILLAGTGMIVYRLADNNRSQQKQTITRNESLQQDTVAMLPQESVSGKAEPAATAVPNEPVSTPTADRELLNSKDIAHARRTPPPLSQPATEDNAAKAHTDSIPDQAVASRQLGLMKEKKSDLNTAAPASPRAGSASADAVLEQPMEKALLVPERDAEPVTGFAAFRRYVETTKKTDTSGAIHGIVVISFTINEQGVPGNFKVEKSLSAFADAEAIRLLKSGPAWKKRNAGKPSFEYSFTF